MASIIDILSGANKVERQKEKAIQFAEERYDPSVYEPQRQQFTQQATEGVAQGVESERRRRTIQSLFRQPDVSIYGGSQARAIAGQQAQSRQAQRGLADFESRLAMQDIQSRQQGQAQLAQVRSQQKQTQAQQDAAIREAEMQAEAEKQRRRQKLGQAALGVGLTIATTPFGGGGSLLARGLGALGGQAASEAIGPSQPAQPAQTVEQAGGLQEGTGFQQTLQSIQPRDIAEPTQTQTTQPSPQPAQTQIQGQQETQFNTQGILRSDVNEEPPQWSVDSLFGGPVESATSSTQMDVGGIQQRISELESRGDSLSFEEFQELDELRNRLPLELTGQQMYEQPTYGRGFGQVGENIYRNITDLFGGITQRERYEQQYGQ